MNLSSGFSIDPCAPWVVAHNREVREVLAAFQADRPIRVPLLCGEWHGQHGLYADEINVDYRQYYTDPDLMLRVQLEAARRRRELPIYDMVLAEPPERWSASVDLWPVVAPGWVGCRLVYRADAQIAHQGIRLSREDADRMTMPDPVRGGLLKTSHEFWSYLRERYRDFTFLGRLLGPIGHGVGHNGFFSLCLDVRGEEVMADMYEEPEFAQRFLTKIASWCVELDRTWKKLGGAGDGPSAFGISDHGIDMLSPQTYERFVVPVIAEMNRRAGTVAPKSLHHCGRGAHLFPIIRKHFGLESINILTWPFVDVARVRRELGEAVWIQAVVADHIVRQGPAERIRDAVREVMKAKGRGRFALNVGDMLRGTPLERRLALYEAVKEFGRYS